MTEDRDHDLQDWFNRGVEELPRQPFTLAVLTRVRRRERNLRLQRYAASLMAVFIFWLLLPELIAILDMLAALPLTLIGASREQWPLLVLAASSLAWWLLKHGRNTGILSWLVNSQ